ncbi:MAG: hypothetical protein U0X76_07045 [Bacteroidia bacterium]
MFNRYAVLFAVFAFCFFSCINKEKNDRESGSLSSENTEADSSSEETNQIVYPDSVLLAYFDSIAALPVAELVKTVKLQSDTDFRNVQPLDISLSDEEFAEIRQAAKSEALDVNLAAKIFPGYQPDSTDSANGLISVSFFSFDRRKNDFKEFAICPGGAFNGWGCDIFFFEGKKIIARRHAEHHYGLELKSFKDADGKTVVYYRQNFESGTGIWWYNFYFYKYSEGKIIPVLDEIENSNLGFPWSIRSMWLKSTVVRTNPLTLKIVYSQALEDTVKPRFIENDSTFVNYKWNSQKQCFEGDYQKAGLSKDRLYSYYLDNSSDLFINLYAKQLKQMLSERENRGVVLGYLNEAINLRR